MYRQRWDSALLDILIVICLISYGYCRKQRSTTADKNKNFFESNPLANSVDFIWSTQTVAAADTAVLHCSFDAIFSQLRNGMIDWVRESSIRNSKEPPQLLATGKKVVIPDKRYRVYRPHNSALSVLIIRRAKKKDAGIFRCNLSGSSTRHKYLVLNITDSKIEALTSPARLKARIGKDIILWCNATGYPKPVVYWTREDRNRKLPDGSYQYWGNGLEITRANEADTGIYACYLDNFVQPVVSYKFSLMVEDRPWEIDAWKMRFDSSQWYRYDSDQPKPSIGKSYLLMCETRGTPTPLPKIRWLRDGKPVRNSKHFYIIEDRPEWRQGYTSATLVIMRFVPRFQGNYTCIASNIFRVKQQTYVIEGYVASDGIIPQEADNQMKSNGTTKTDGITKPISFDKPGADDARGTTTRIKNTGVARDTELDNSMETDDEDYEDVESGSGPNKSRAEE